MALLAVKVPAPEKRKTLRRRMYRAGERLWERGVNRVLVDKDFPPALWEPLAEAGLSGVEVETLCQSAAEGLILAALARRGIDPARATVCLRGYHAAGAIQQAALGLARRVNRLVIDCPGRGEALALWLSREYGLPLMEPGVIQADVTADFSAGRERAPADLRLYGSTPDLGGLALRPRGWSLPPEIEPLPLLAALRDCGRLGEVEVVEEPPADHLADFPS